MFCPLQSCKQRLRDELGDESEDEDEHNLAMPTCEDGKPLGAEDQVVFDPSDEEESGDDAWFDEFIERGLSITTMPDGEDDTMPDSQQHQEVDTSGAQLAHEAWLLGLDTQPFDNDEMLAPDLKEPTTHPEGVGEKGMTDVMSASQLREVARPLQGSEDAGMQTPTKGNINTPAKTDILTVTSSDPSPEKDALAAQPVLPPPGLEGESRAERIAYLKEQLALLESMEGNVEKKDGWGYVCIFSPIICMYLHCNLLSKTVKLICRSVWNHN